MATPRLDGLIGRDRLGALLASTAAIAPGLSVRVLDASEVEIAAQSTPGAAEPASTVRSLLAIDGEAIGSVVVGSATEAIGQATADLVARAIELAATESLGRQTVVAAAIDDLRELSLLSGLSGMLASVANPADIAGCVLSTVSEPLGPADGFVLGPDDATLLATSAPAADVAALRVHAAPLIAQLRDEDPTVGSCAEVAAAPGDRFGSILAAFLRTARGHHGTMVLGRPAGAAPFSAADRRLLAAVAGQAAVAIERAGLQREVADRRVLDQELAIGRRIQISLMPHTFPKLAGWEIASAYEPAREVGGDFYDVFRLRDRGECIGLVVADVTGKGIPAAILMADARGLIHAAADHGDDPSDTLARVNQILVRERASGLFVTVVHGRLDAATGRLLLARAGHDPVHVLRADGRLEILEPPGRLIGMVDDIGAVTIEVVLEPGDAFIGHTDGVTEARSSDGAFYGEDRFRALIGKLAGESAATIVAAVDADVAAFRGGAEPSDDLTLLVVRREATDGSVDAPNGLRDLGGEAAG